MDRQILRSAVLAVLLVGVAGCTGNASRTVLPVEQRTDEAEKKAEQNGVIAASTLDKHDPIDSGRPGCHVKAYEQKMTAGTEYIINLRSLDFDAFLRILDAEGKLLAEDDDSGGQTDAQVLFQAPKTGTYRLLATSFTPGQTGAFTLSLQAPGTAAALGSRHTVAQGTDFGDLVVLADAASARGLGAASESAHGYVEYRITVGNRSANVAHRVTVTIPRTASPLPPGGTYLQALRRSATVLPQSAEALRLWQPNLPFDYGVNSLGVVVDGRRAATPVPLTLQVQRGIPPGRPNGTPQAFSRHILLASGLGPALERHVVISAVGQPPPAGNQSFGISSGHHNGQAYTYVAVNRFHQAMVPVSAWGEHWLGHSRYDGIVARAAQLQAAPPAVQQALWRYVECGGTLLILGTYPVPSPWQPTVQKVGRFAAYYPAFGQCLVAVHTDASQWNVPEWQAVTAMWEQSARPWLALATANDANTRFPVVDATAIPVRDLFVIMLAFSVAIGPVSLLILSWLRRRIWLLWTVPVCSLLTCAAVVGYMAATEDWNGYVRCEGVTILDENTGQATSIGWLGLYTPQTPGDGLHFSYDTELSPHLAPTGRHDPSPRTLDWTSDQHLASGWLTARIPAHFLLRTSEPRAERLAVERQANGAVALTNCLGAAITRLWLADRDGKVYTGEAIAADGRIVLAPTATRARATGAYLRTAFAADWLKLVDAVAAQPEDVLRPGSYLAVLDDAPFIPTGLASAESRRSRSVVLGTLKTP